MDPKQAIEIGRRFLAEFRKPSPQIAAELPILTSCEEGWSNACPCGTGGMVCAAPLVNSWNRYKGEPGVRQEDIDAGRIVTNCKPYVIGSIILICGNGHRFQVEAIQRRQAAAFQFEWRGFIRQTLYQLQSNQYNGISTVFLDGRPMGRVVPVPSGFVAQDVYSAILPGHYESVDDAAEALL